jgi:hypothetical protein
MQALSAGEAVASEQYGFSEPDISFEIIYQEEGRVMGLTVNLKDEFQPPTKVLVPRQDNMVSLRFHTPPEVLRAFADGLQEGLIQFPLRGERPG